MTHRAADSRRRGGGAQACLTLDTLLAWFTGVVGRPHFTCAIALHLAITNPSTDLPDIGGTDLNLEPDSN